MKNSTNKILTIAVILLLLVNIAMVIFIVKGRKPYDSRRGKDNPVEMMEKELNMTEQQKNEVKKLRDEHFTKIRPLFDSVRAAKSAFFSLIKDPNVSDSILSIYSKRITERQAAVNKLTFAHFRSVRALLNPDQQVKYDEFVQKMMQRSGRRKDSTENKK
jgi:periplasmic protein CpxP/Spy